MMKRITYSKGKNARTAEIIFTNRNTDLLAPLTHPERWDIHTPVQWETFHLGTTHRWEQTGDRFEF